MECGMCESCRLYSKLRIAEWQSVYLCFYFLDLFPCYGLFVPHAFSFWFNCSAPALYSWDSGFKSQPVDLLSWLEVFVIFASLSRQILGYCLKLGHDVFLRYLFFTIHCRVTIPHSTAWRKLTARGVRSILLFYFIIICVYMPVNSI